MASPTTRQNPMVPLFKAPVDSGSLSLPGFTLDELPSAENGVVVDMQGNRGIFSLIGAGAGDEDETFTVLVSAIDMIEDKGAGKVSYMSNLLWTLSFTLGQEQPADGNPMGNGLRMVKSISITSTGAWATHIASVFGESLSVYNPSNADEIATAAVPELGDTSLLWFNIVPVTADSGNLALRLGV